MKKIVKKTISTALLLALVSTTSIETKAYVTCNDITITKDTDNNGNTTYTNKANGRTCLEKADGTTQGNKEYKLRSSEVLSSESVEVGKYKEISVTLPYGQASVSKLKVKKGKNVLSAKVSSKAITKGLKLNAVKDSNGNYYYLDRVTGERVYTGGAPYIYVDYADYKIRIYGKKTGKAYLQFQINDSNNNKVATKKIRINVVNDDKPIVSATLGGKSLLFDYSKNGTNTRNLYYNGTADGASMTTKKGGKLKIKLNKNYKLETIYLRKRNEYEQKNYSGTLYSGTYAGSKITAVDLNGDGDCNDIIDGIEENANSEYHFEKVRNGKKIVLSTVPNAYTKTNQTVNKTGKNMLVDYNSGQAITEIIVIYRDKRTGARYNWKNSIVKKVG